MNEKTKSDYRKLAASFYKKRMGDLPPSPKRLADALVGCAGEYRPAYWRRLRNAIAFDQEEKGYPDAAARVNNAKNPVTKTGEKAGIKPKQARTRRVTEDDEKKLMEYFTKRDDSTVTAALYVVQHTGARPVELAGITVIDDQHVLIPGAKQSHGGTRGADRVIELPREVIANIRHAVPWLQGDVKSVQNKLSAAGKNLWPQRKSTPTLYSWRHQLGANLKASGLGRDEIAYVMGHQATESADRYGKPRTARGGRVMPRASREADLSNIRENHGEAPEAKMPVTARVSKHKAMEKQGLEAGRSL